MNSAYVHGYNPRESTRLQDQAATLVELLHADTAYPPGEWVLEAGCGVGAQSVPLARNSPEACIVSMDISMDSLAEARRRVAENSLANVSFHRGNLFHPSFPVGTFDHVFVCFVLEHLADPLAALATLKAQLKPGGTLTVIEGDHGSAYFHPDSKAAHRAIQCQVELQRRAGGDAMIGRRLFPLLTKAGYAEVHVSPRLVYADDSRPEMVEGFTRNTFTAMIEGVRQASLEAGLIDRMTFERGIRDLYRTAEPGGVFCYTFFKATAVNSGHASDI